MPRLRREVVEKKETSGSTRTIGTRTRAGGRAVGVEDKGVKKNEVENTGKGTSIRKRSLTDVVASNIKKPRTKFPDRLQWRMAHASMPPTSTPIRNPKSTKLTKADIDSAFGFDDSMEKVEYSTLLSPIAHAGDPDAILPPISHWKVNPLTQRNAPLTSTKPPVVRNRNILKHKETEQQGRRSQRTPTGRAVTIPVLSALRPQTPVTTKEPVKEVSKTKVVSADGIGLPSLIDITDESTVPLSQPKSSVAHAESQAPPEEVPEQLPKSPKEPPKPKRGRPRGAAKKTLVSKQPTDSAAPKTTTPSPTVDQEKLPRRTTRRTTRAAPALEPEETPEKVEVKKPKVSKRNAGQPEEMLKREEPSMPRLFKEIAPIQPKDSLEILISAKGKLPKKTKTTSVPKKTKTAPVHIERKAHLFEGTLEDDTETRAKGESPFSQLLHRYNEDEDEHDVDKEFRVDPRKIVKTYASRKRVPYSEERDSEAEYDFIPRLLSHELIHDDAPAIAEKGKRTRKRKGAPKNGKEEDDLDEETRKWLEEKNKEFEDVARVKLVVEKSFSE